MGYPTFTDPNTGVLYNVANNPCVPNPREHCFDFGEVEECSKKGCTQQEESVTIRLKNSPVDNHTMTLEGSNAEDARLKVGGTWFSTMPVIVVFSGPGEPCQVKWWPGP